MATAAIKRAPATSTPLYKSLFVQVLAALVLGAVLGVVTPDFAISLKILSDGFLKLITMIVAPIVFCVVVHGIAGAGDLKKVGRVGVKALVYFEVMTTVALRLKTSTSCKAAASAASFSTSSRPRRSMRWRATTCCRCCSSPCCSVSRWRWSAARRRGELPR
jgi:L-cystine uptake protein TcyP (sodium:dicarboxylate symporter family)